jgi:hypothetical protein
MTVHATPSAPSSSRPIAPARSWSMRRIMPTVAVISAHTMS